MALSTRGAILGGSIIWLMAEQKDRDVNRFSTYLPITLLTIAHGSVDFYVNLLPALAPGMATRLDIPLGRVIALIGVMQLVTNGVQPLVGWIMGNRNLSWIIWCGLILSIFPAFMGYAVGFWSLAFLVVLGGAGTGIFHPEAVLTAHDSGGRHDHLAMPFFMAGGYFLSAAAAPICLHWVDWFDYPALVWFAIPGLIMGAYYFLQHRKSRRNHPSVVIKPRSRRETKREEGRLSFWPLLLVSIFCTGATALFMAILTSHYALTFGEESKLTAGWVILIVGGLGSLASFFWGHICRNRNYYVAVFITQLLSAPLFYLLAHAGTPMMGVAIAFPLALISPGAVYPVSVSLVRNASGLTQALRAGLVVGGAWGLAALLVMGAGELLDRGVPSSSLVAVCAISCLCTAAVAGFQLLRSRKAAAK